MSAAYFLLLHLTLKSTKAMGQLPTFSDIELAVCDSTKHILYNAEPHICS